MNYKHKIKCTKIPQKLLTDTWLSASPGGLLGYKRDRGVRRIFLGLKFSTPVFFWVEDLTVYFLGSEKSARIFLGSNFRQANSSYAIQANHVFFWVHNIRSMYFFGCKILGSVGPPRHVYTQVTHLGRRAGRAERPPPPPLIFFCLCPIPHLGACSQANTW